MMKRLLTYGLLLLTILSSHFVVSACQDDLSDTTEVMMTFTTRAVTQGAASTAPVVEQMKQLRVIMLREDGTVVGNHLEPEINASSVTFTFTTPIQTGGEDFTFLAVANEGSIQPTSKLSWLSCSPGDKLSEETITQIKAQQIGDGSAFNINKGPIPQTKQWTVHVPQASTHVENQQLDFVASKISVQFLNHTMESQTLSGIRISGIGSAADGYLFAQTNNDFGTQGASSNITFSDVTVSAGEPSGMLSYYTYPVNTISSPTLYATWNGKEYNLPIKINEAFISSLPRNQHLQIVVTLTGEGMMYHVVSWEENPTNIGSPTPEGGYQVDGWGNGNNIIIGGETGEEPEEPGGGDTPVIPGDVIWDKGPKEIGWQEDKFELTDARIKNSSSICIVIDVKGNAHGQIQLQGYIPGYFNITNLAQGETDKHVIINTTQNNAPPDGSLILEGAGITLKKIYIPTTSE